MTASHGSLGASHSTRVLVVDDDPSIREVVTEVLELDGYAVETAANGAEALEKVQAQAPNAIVLDLMMPGMDGWQFMDACSAERVCEDVPVLVLSAARDLRPTTEGLRDKKIAAVLPKPFNIDTLVAAVHELHRPR
jgi:two-component system response regulator MprA